MRALILVAGGALVGLALLPVLSSPSPTVPQQARPEAPKVTYAEAIRVAEARRPGFVIEVEYSKSADSRYWEVSLLGRGGAMWEVYVDAEEGNVTEIGRIEYSEDWSETRPERTRVTAKEAADTALKYRGGQVMEIEMDREDGKLEWDVYIRADRDGKIHEVSIAADSGRFLRIEIEEEWPG